MQRHAIAEVHPPYLPNHFHSDHLFVSCLKCRQGRVEHLGQFWVGITLKSGSLFNRPQQAGSVGTIVDVYADGEFEVEFTDEEGDTIACLTVKSGQIKLRKRQDSINRFSAMYRNDRDMFDFVVGLLRCWQP